jgi:peptide/nickel transport system substrate-binding protein
MIDRMTKLRWRRRYRRSRQSVEDIGQQAERHLERHFFRRLNRLWEVRRFIAAWIVLLLLLIGGVVVQTRALSTYYQQLRPAPGGIYTEGILGGFTNANPLYATSAADAAAARLVFSSLFTYNAKNHLVGDIAEKYDRDPHETTYTVHLKRGINWQDGMPLTSADVVFTYQVIQNPDAQSPLRRSWQGITVRAKGDYTVIFSLSNPLSSFPFSLTNGIVPKHLLAGRPMAQLRSVPFNSVRPVGSGPFQWKTIEVVGTTPETREERIALEPFKGYYQGAPKLGGFIIRAFHDEKRLVDSFNHQELNGVAGLNDLPDSLKKDAAVHDYSVPLTGGTFVFFKTTQGVLKDTAVRQALVLAANTGEVLDGVGYPVVAVREPLLSGQIGYDKKLRQPTQDVAAASKILDEAGWKRGRNGLRTKGGQTLGFHLYSQNSSEYTYITQVLQRQWRAIGVDVQVFLQASTDMQAVLTAHDYDALLYGIAIGPDPDVFAYWHSSQADPRGSRLNFSEYRSSTADRSLEAGRTRSNAKVRAIKYKPFLEAWRNDTPALALYQPRFLYLTRGELFNFNPTVMNTDIDRFANVDNWMIKQAKTDK